MSTDYTITPNGHELKWIRERYEEALRDDPDEPQLSALDMGTLLDEVDRLRTELETISTEANAQCREAAARTVRAETERDAARAELAAVDELHQPYDTPDDPHASRRCKGCIAGYDPRTGNLVRCAWPCPTKRARATSGEQR